MYICYLVHTRAVYDLCVFSFVYIQNSAQSYYVSDDIVPEVGTQSTSVEFHTLRIWDNNAQ